MLVLGLDNKQGEALAVEQAEGEQEACSEDVEETVHFRGDVSWTAEPSTGEPGRAGLCREDVAGSGGSGSAALLGGRDSLQGAAVH